MAEDIKTGTIANVGEVVNAIVADAKSTNTVITAVVGSIKKIAEAKVADVKLNDVKHVGKMVDVYKDMLKNIIDALCSQDKTIDGKIQNLEALLDYKVDEEKSTADKKVFKYGAINAALQIPKIIDSMFGIIGKVADMNLGFKTLIKFRMNIKKLKLIITYLFKELLNVFASINVDKQWEEMLKYIIKQPDTTLKFYTQVDNGKNDKQASLDHEQFVGGNFGILDVFAKTFEIINSLNNLQTPNFINLKIQLLRMRLALRMVLSHLVTWGKKNINDDVILQLMYIEDALIGPKNSKGVRDGGISAIITALNEVFMTIDLTKIGIVKLVVFKLAITMLGWVISGLLKLLPNLESLAKPSNIDIINNANEVFKGIENIFKSIVIIGLLAIPAMVAAVLGAIALVFITVFVLAVKGLMWVMEKVKLDGNVLSPLTDVIKSLKQVMIDILILGLASIPATLAIIPVLIFVLGLTIMVFLLWGISKLIKEVSEEVIKNLNQINEVILALAFVGLCILLFALITPIIVQTLSGNILPFLLILAGAMLLMWVLLKLTAKLASKASGDAITIGISMLLIVGSLLIAAISILVLALVGKMFIDDPMLIVGILVIIAGIILISAAAVGLGIALSFASPYIGWAIGGIGPIVVLLGLMVGAGLAIMSLAGYKFDFGSYKKGSNENDMGTGTGAMGNVGKILAFVKWMRNQIGNKDKNAIKGARREKRFMKQVKKTVERIAAMAESLNSISKLKLNENNIKSNTTQIFTFIEDLDTFIDTKLLSTEEKNAKSNYNLFDFIVPGGFILKAINNRNNDKNVKANTKLNRINKVVSTLKNIGTALTSIQNLQIDNKTIKTKVGQVFTFIDDLSVYINDFLSKNDSDQSNYNVLDFIIPVSGIAKFINNRSKDENVKANKKLNKVEAVITTMQNICMALDSIKNLKLDENATNNIKSNVESMFKSIDDIGTIIKNKSKTVKVDEKTIESVQPIITYIQQLDDSFKNVSNVDTKTLKSNLGHYINFIDKVNTIEVEKVQKTAQMFEQMSQFSSNIRGDFDKLAEALSEKMLPVLEDLKTVMEKVPDKLDMGFANTSASIAAASAPVTAENVTKQLEREKPYATKEEVKKEVESRMAEKAQSDANGISAKLDELIGLLRGYNGTAIVKTV